MTSTNTPILKEILRELTEFKKEMHEFKKEMYEFKKEMYEFRDSVIHIRRNVSMIQEKSDAEYFRKYLTIENPTLNVNLWNFGDFYNKNGEILTDIDGCITVDSFPYKPEIRNGLKNNSLQAKNIRNSIFFIESKNLLDKVKLDYKIKQFNIIISLIKNITHTNLDNVSNEFKEMIQSYPLKTQPSEIYLIISANDLSVNIRSFIEDINADTLTEEKYKEYVYKMFVEDSIFKMLGKYIKNLSLKKRYKSAKTFDEFVDILKDPFFIQHSNYINSFFTKYNDVKQTYSKIKGLVGYIFYGNVTMPINF